MKSLTLLFVLLNFASACSDQFKATNFDSNSSKGKVLVTLTAKTRNELPQCDNSAQGLAAYLTETGRFVKCADGTWNSTRPGDTSSSYLQRSPVRYHEW